MMIIQGRNVSWNKTTVPRKAKQTGKKNKVILTTFKSFPDKKSFHYSSQVGPADPKWDEWLNMEINVLDIPRFVLYQLFWSLFLWILTDKLKCIILDQVCQVVPVHLLDQEKERQGGAHHALLGQH